MAAEPTLVDFEAAATGQDTLVPARETKRDSARGVAWLRDSEKNHRSAALDFTEMTYESRESAASLFSTSHQVSQADSV